MRESVWLELDHIDSVLLLTAIRQAIAKSIVAFYQKYELFCFCSFVRPSCPWN
jgi:hypothetical protein